MEGKNLTWCQGGDGPRPVDKETNMSITLTDLNTAWDLGYADAKAGRLPNCTWPTGSARAQHYERGFIAGTLARTADPAARAARIRAIAIEVADRMAA